ncbi:MAG: exosortase-associated EpsI family protein [bacterium]|nr:exosortase-associated EpsI family protein [bacterium]
MVAHVGAEENRQASVEHRGIVLLVLAALVLFMHADLADFDPEPYGTVPIDGSEVELFAPAGGSPILIFAVAGLLLAGRRRELERALGQPARWGTGLSLLALGAGIGRWADYVGATELLIPGLIAVLLGAAAVLGGTRGLRAIAIPALFLVFAFPIPAGVVNQIVWPAQLWTAWSADGFLRAVGFSTERLADVIVLEGHAFQVIETCSGMRMIETLVMAGALYSVLFYRRPSQVLAILLIAPLLGYFVNFARVISIIFNPYAKWSSVHSAQGIVMLVVGVLMIAGFDHLLQQRERRQGLAPRALPATSSIAPLAWPRLVGLASLFALLGIANFSIDPWKSGEPTSIRAFEIPHQIAGAKARGLKLDRQFLGSVGVTHWLHREYEIDGHRVQIQILADDRLDRRGSLLSAKTAIPGRAMVELERDVAPLGDGSWVDRHLFAGRNRRTLVYHWYEGMSRPFEESLRNALALDRGAMRRNTWALSVRLSTPVAEEDGAVEKADARLRDFAEEIRSALP